MTSQAIQGHLGNVGLLIETQEMHSKLLKQQARASVMHVCAGLCYQQPETTGNAQCHIVS